MRGARGVDGWLGWATALVCGLVWGAERICFSTPNLHYNLYSSNLMNSLYYLVAFGSNSSRVRLPKPGFRAHTHERAVRASI